MSDRIELTAIVEAPIEAAWAAFTRPEDIMAWNHASPDWHCPAAANDLREGGQFSYTMAAWDGSFSFDFGGTYTTVIEHRLIEYALEDGRGVTVTFETQPDGTTLVTETFDPESQNPLEMQREGWQAILDNYAAHAKETVA